MDKCDSYRGWFGIASKIGRRADARLLRVAAGTGTVDSSVLANQTALVNEKQTLTFQPPNVLDGAKIKVPVMLNNIGLETGYTMQQLGFFADDPDDGEILYAIVQDEVGDTVPSQTESPGFVIEWAFVFQFGNASEVTVTLDPVGLVSIGMVGQPNGVAGLGENGAVPIAQGGTGATTAQDAVIALGALLALAAAAAYDPEGSYAVGDYCTHGGKLHKCNTPIPSGEAWNAEHWTATTVARELAAVNTELDHKLVIYTSLESLGLTESNATIQSIIAAMADNTLLAASCGTDGYDAGWLPASYGFLRIQKITVYHTMLEYQIIYPNARIWRGYYNAASVGSEWSGWEMISIATPPQEHEISFRSGWSNAAKSTYYKTQEGSCVINCAVYGTGVASDNFIATLPAGFRPNATVCRAAHAYKGGIRGIAEAQIAANGDIVIYSPIEFDCVSFGATFLAQN